MTAEQVFTVPESGAGERLDVWLAGELGVPRRYVRQLIALGKLRGKRDARAAGQRLAAGERVYVAAFRHPRDGALPSPDMDLPVLARRGSWLAVDKPAGTPAHPIHFEEDHTMVNAFLARYPEAAQVGDGGLYAGLVHRLDPGTSGVLLFATEQEGWRRARAAFRGREAEKRYVARVHGALRVAQPRALSLFLEARGARMRVVGAQEGGREALTTLLRSEPAADGTSRVELAIATGVRHQIRATLAQLGHPVVGDTLYGSPPARRIALHAAYLRIEDFAVESAVPDL
jgi:23S rRNA pseudouridine1911/1915/1917 synthase